LLIDGNKKRILKLQIEVDALKARGGGAGPVEDNIEPIVMSGGDGASSEMLEKL